MKQKFIDYLETLIYAVLAGVCISIAGMAYLSAPNKITGALFFVVGLFIILTFRFNLFTGKVCYIFTNSPEYSIKTVVIYIGNFLGANLTGFLFSLSRLDDLQAKCIAIAATKANDNLLSLFILGIFCNILIYVAVEGFKSKNILTQYFSLFFGVSVFVLCGFEHSIADMFYFAFARNYSGKAFLALLMVTLGNIVGGVLFELIKLLFNRLKKEKLPNSSPISEETDNPPTQQD